MECGNCSMVFNSDEAVRVHGTNRFSNKGRVIAHECPGCGEELSKRFTRERNIESCAHNATSDEYIRSDYQKTCQECGAMWDEHGRRVGIKEAWAIPASDGMKAP